MDWRILCVLILAPIFSYSETPKDIITTDIMESYVSRHNGEFIMLSLNNNSSYKSLDAIPNTRFHYIPESKKKSFYRYIRTAGDSIILVDANESKIDERMLRTIMIAAYRNQKALFLINNDKGKRGALFELTPSDNGCYRLKVDKEIERVVRYSSNLPDETVCTDKNSALSEPNNNALYP